MSIIPKVLRGSSILNGFSNVKALCKVPDGVRGTYHSPRADQHGLGFPNALYGGRYRVTMLAGDGIGPEMMGYVKQVFRTAGAPVDFEDVKLDCSDTSEEVFRNALLAIKRNGVAIKGSIESKYAMSDETISRNVALRLELDLFANVLHCKAYSGVRARFDDIDIVMIRQNTEGEYSMLEHETVPGVVECMKIITRVESERLARYAFKYAQEHGRKRITAVHKANIMKLSDGLFLEACGMVAKEYPDIKYDNMIVDNTCMQLVSNPRQFDVMVLPNLYGNVVSNVVCGLAGGAGLYSGRNYGDQYSVFEPGTRNTGTSIANKNLANPIAMLNASVDLLRHMQLNKHADLISDAITTTLSVDKIHTCDLGGEASSTDVVECIMKHIKETREA